MPFITNTDKDRAEMLDSIGVSKFEDLLVDIPNEYILTKELNLEKGLSEWEITQKAMALAKKNISTNDYTSFLGAGVYDHYIPSVINSIISRPEFITAYTPYQAEVSQGTLQTIYEYQTMICNLTGMEVSNASMYDGATALAEAGKTACLATRRNKLLVSSTILPGTLEVLKTFYNYTDFEMEIVEEIDGLTPYEAFAEKMTKDVAAIMVQTPNYYGNIEDLEKFGQLAHDNKSLFVISVDPISLGLLKKPSELGADIVVAEGQGLGIAQSYGGPYLGILASTKKLMRKIPGRIVGRTEDVDGKRGFVLTLQTREQHIRRAKATSNICTAQALCALSAGIYMSYMGESGFKEVAENSYLRAHYLAEEIAKLDGFELKYSNAPFFKEFVVKTKYPVDQLLKRMMTKKIFAGIALDTLSGKDNDCFLVAVTEKRTKEEMDFYVDSLKEIVSTM